MQIFMYNDEDFYLHHSYDREPRRLFPGRDGNFGMHAHENFELYCFLRGDCSYIVEGTRYPLKPGSIMIMRPAEIHCLEVDGDADYERIALNFSQRVIEAVDPMGLLLESFFNRPLGKLNLYESGNFNRYVIKMVSKEREMSRYERRLTIMTNMLPLLSEIREIFRLKMLDIPRANETGESAMIDYINQNLGGDLSLDILADMFFISKSQLNRRFKKLTGATVGEYVTAKRLLYARERIIAGVSATQASRECGFNDYSTFYRAYKKKFGISPVRTGGQSSEKVMVK